MKLVTIDGDLLKKEELKKRELVISFKTTDIEGKNSRINISSGWRLKCENGFPQSLNIQIMRGLVLPQIEYILEKLTMNFNV